MALVVDNREEANIVRMLKDSLLGERMAMRGYEIMIQAAPNEEDRALLVSIQRDERRHTFLLNEIYEEITGQSFHLARASVSMPKDFCEMVKTSICDELDAAVFYESLAGALRCIRQKETVLVILNEEKEHARILAGMYQRCAN